MSYFDQFYIKTCFRQVWKIVKCKLLEVFLLVTCKSVSLNWLIERSHALLLFYLSCKLKRVGRLHDVKQLFWKPANDENCFILPLRYKMNQVWSRHWRVWFNELWRQSFLLSAHVIFRKFCMRQICHSKYLSVQLFSRLSGGYSVKTATKKLHFPKLA